MSMPRHVPDPCVAHLAARLAWEGRGLVTQRWQAERFLSWLDPAAQQFSFRTFSETSYTRLPGRDPLERAIHAPLHACWEELTALNRAGAAVSVTINATNGRGRTAADVVRVRALVLDDDHPESRSGPLLPQPHASVQSSAGRLHRYWRVRGVDAADFRRLQQALARRYSGDHRVCAPNQSMGLPGLWRRKPGRPPFRTALVVLEEGPPMEAAQVMAWLGRGM
jgi:hypothetical protein